MFSASLDILDILLIICIVVLIVLVLICLFKNRSSTTSSFKSKSESFLAPFSNKLSFVNQWFRAISGCN